MDTGELDVRHILGILKRQFRLILGSIVVVLLISAAFVFSVPSVYTATSLVLFDPQQRNMLDADTQLATSQLDNGRIESEVEILRSDSILLKVIENENLVSDSYFGPSLGLTDRLLVLLRLKEPELPTREDALAQVISKLRGAISVQRRGITYLIAIQVSSPDADRSAHLANAIASTYISDQLGSKVANVRSSLDAMRARMESARSAISSSESAIDTFIAENIPKLGAGAEQSDLTATQRQIEQLDLSRRTLSSELESLQAAVAVSDWQSLVTRLQTEAASELEAQRNDLASRISSTAPLDTAELRAELEQIEEQLIESANQRATSLRSEIASNQEREDILRQGLRDDVVNANVSSDLLARIYELQQSASLARTQYQTLLVRTEELATQADLQLADSRIVSPALMPATPSFPNPRLILSVASVLALGLGIALAFLYENYIGGFTSEEQQLALLKTFGSISVPRTRRPEGQLCLSSTIADAPLSGYSEALRRLRATLDQARDRESVRDGMVIMITSTAPNEGKSTIALSLARSYALAGRSTLLIDCDLRKPTIHRQLGIESSRGLYDFLSSREGEIADLASITSVDQASGALVVVGARQSDTPTDQLLQRRSFARLMSAARSAFEITILDTPPVGPVVDGLYLAPVADAIVFVSLWAQTPQVDVRSAVASLASVKAPHAKIISVLNQAVESRRAYRMKYGGYHDASTQA
jgi:capsular exopolysaccharide synthesis family protein